MTDKIPPLASGLVMLNSAGLRMENDGGAELVVPFCSTKKDSKHTSDWKSAVDSIIAKGNIAEVKQGKNGIVVFEVKKQLKSVPD